MLNRRFKVRSARSSEEEMKEVQLDLAVVALKKEQTELAEVNKVLYISVYEMCCKLSCRMACSV